MTDKPVNPYTKAYASFVEQTKAHQLVVLKDDGLYRHLRIQAPGTRMWSWDITTWPGYLATSGDIADGYMFTRLTDMIDFFTVKGRSRDYYSDGAPSIDVRYWAEKLAGGRSMDVKEYQPELFLQRVREHLEESEGLGDEAQTEYNRQIALLRKIYEPAGSGVEALQKNLAEQHQAARRFNRLGAERYSILYAQDHTTLHLAKDKLWSTESLTDEQHDVLSADPDWHELGDTDIPEESPAERRAELLEDAKWHADSEHEAREWLSENEELVGGDTWEWDLRDYDIHFLFTCYCIDLGVQLYLEHQKQENQQDVGHDDANRVGELTDEQRDAVILFAERGYTLELGSLDPRMTYTDAEKAEMKARFENVCSGLNALRAQRDPSAA